MYYSANPLEQFEVTSIIIPNVLILFALVITVLYLTNTWYDFRVTNVLALVTQNMYNLIAGLQKENLQLTRQYFYLPIMYLFQILLIANLSGLAPYAFTLTSSFVVTFFLASAFFIFINVIGTYNLQYEMFNLFLPSQTPLWIVPFLILVELLSYVARVFSLSIRLFANMMSGHALLKILIGFAFAMLASTLAILSILPWTIVTIIMVLEILIAFLQAYVFVVLITLYISDIVFAH